VPMRVSAIAANLLFIAYGGLGPFYPVLVLHLILLPLNLGRLIEALGQTASASSPSLIEEWRRHGEAQPSACHRGHRSGCAYGELARPPIGRETVSLDGASKRGLAPGPPFSHPVFASLSCAVGLQRRPEAATACATISETGFPTAPMSRSSAS
jgi:hypothetical protein